MAASNPTTETDICNLALARIGANLIEDGLLDDEDSTQAIYCRMFYAPTRDALLRSHWWRFAKSRSTLTATTAPSFEWTYAYTLPTDFLRFKSFYEDNNTTRKNTVHSYELEGSTLLTNESPCKIRYIKQVTTVTSFDPLFISVLVLELALQLCMPLSEDPKILERLQNELYGSPMKPGLMARVRAMDRAEGVHIGRAERNTWNTARFSNNGRRDDKLGSA